MVIRILLASAALAALAACSSEQPLPPPDMVKSIHVEHVRVQYAAAFAPGVSELPAPEVTRLDTFLDQAGMLPGDRVFVSAPTNDPLAGARTGRLASLLARHGLGIEPVPPPPGGIEPNRVLVLVDRYVAVPPACPDWSDDPSGSHSNNVTSSNYGCATLSDLGADGRQSARSRHRPHDGPGGRGPRGQLRDALSHRHGQAAERLVCFGASSGGSSSSSTSSSGMSSSASSSAPASQ